MSKLITIAVPEDWNLDEDMLTSGADLDFIEELKEVLDENGMFLQTFTVGDIIEVDADDFVGNCVVTKDTTDGTIFLVQEGTEIPYGVAVNVADETKISLAEMDRIVGSEDYCWV
jgi:hypothetical protein